MKQLIITLLTIAFTGTLCYAMDSNQIDDIKVEYITYGNDTVYYKTDSKLSKAIECGLKQYENDLFGERHLTHNKIDLEDLINTFNCDDTNRVAFYTFVVRNILEGYGKERCSEMIKNNSYYFSLYICADIQGNIIDLSFNYDPSVANYMTPQDIIRNTRILQNCVPVPFFSEYAEMGVKILPPLSIEIFKSFIERYINEQ